MTLTHAVIAIYVTIPARPIARQHANVIRNLGQHTGAVKVMHAAIPARPFARNTVTLVRLTPPA